MQGTEDFIAGMLSVIQDLVVFYEEDTIAEELLRNSGYSKEDFLKSQKESAYESRKMNLFIKKAFGEASNE